MRTFVAEDGSKHPVSDAAAALLDKAFGPAWPSLTDSEAQLQKLLKGEFPSKNQTDHIRACDMIRNMNASVRELEGRDHNAVFGEETPLDVVKFTTWQPDTCNCIHRYMWRRDQSEDKRVHYGHRILTACAGHSHLAHDAAAHHAAIQAENQAKNRAVK
jgi:hypothetical protein